MRHLDQSLAKPEGLEAHVALIVHSDKDVTNDPSCRQLHRLDRLDPAAS